MDLKAWNKVWIICIAVSILTVFSFSEKKSEASQEKTENDGVLTIAVEVENATPVKAVKKVEYYLPDEIMPGHVISSAGLKLSKDSFDGRLYLKNDFEFEAYETKTFQIRVKDVWTMPLDRIDLYVNEARRLRDVLKDTPYREISDLLCEKVIKRAEEIKSSQGKASSVREHVDVFRKNEGKLAEIWQAIDRLREMNSIAERQSMKGFSKERIETILLIVTTFLIVLSTVFFMIWAFDPKKRPVFKK
jgi:hypothetical protein